METRTIEVNGNVYLFENTWRSTRNGFSHTSTVFKNGVELTNRTVQYLNRTWEKYTYQTSMRCAVDKLMTQLVDEAISEWKYKHNWERFKKGEKNLCVAEATSTPEYKELRQLMEALN